MANGIYYYYDNLRCEIIYVGKDSYIDKNKRHRQHYHPSKRDEQKINEVLQNDNKSGRYSYHILEQGDFTNDELNQKEINWIKFFDPKFNFTEGGDGFSSGEKHPKYWKDKKRPKETCEKISKNNARYWTSKKLSKEHCEKISESLKGRFSGEKSPNAKYQNAFWDLNNVKYHKSAMFKGGNSNGLNPRRCFRLRYKGKILNIGSFHEWISIEIIAQKINEYQ